MCGSVSQDPSRTPLRENHRADSDALPTRRGRTWVVRLLAYRPRTRYLRTHGGWNTLPRSRIYSAIRTHCGMVARCRREADHPSRIYKGNSVLPICARSARTGATSYSCWNQGRQHRRNNRSEKAIKTLSQLRQGQAKGHV